MACVPSATLTLFSSTTSTTVITSSTVSLLTQTDGTVSSVTLPLIITSIITIVNPTLTQFASCTSTPSPAQPSTSTVPATPTPTTIVVTVTPSPSVVTQVQTSTLANGVVTVLTVTSTTTPDPVVTYLPTFVTPLPTQPSKSSSSIAPIAGGAVGGFFFLICVVAAIWFLFKKCRKPDSEKEEEDVFPFPVTRDRDSTRRLDLNHESRPSYQFGSVGRSTPDGGMTASGSAPALVSRPRASGDVRRDSAAALIGAPSGTPGYNNYGAQARGGDVGRQPSRGSNYQLPPGAAPPQEYYAPSRTGSDSVSASSVAPGSSNRRPLQVTNAPLSPISVRSSMSSGVVPNPGTVPLALPEHERQAWAEKRSVQDLAAQSGSVQGASGSHHIQGHDYRPSSSGLEAVPEPYAHPEPIAPEPTEAPPAYAE